MSISVALQNAVQGLGAAGYGAQVVSNNISNALTPGYARRTLELGSGALGGVTVLGVSRNIDAGLASDRRLAEAGQLYYGAASDFYARFESLLGVPGDANSLSGRLADFEGTLVTAASRPDAPDRLQQAVNAARSLADGIAAASDGVQAARTQADQAIALEVAQLNTALQQVQTLNAQITAAQAKSEETASLDDQRFQVLDQIGTLVPLRIYQRDDGQVALYSTNGALLLEGSAATIEFNGVGQVTPYMSLAGGQLSGITINGLPVSADGANGGLGGGSIGGNFEVRDRLGVEAQAELDAYARDLIERFQDPAVDPSLAPGDAGLFTDQGAAFLPAAAPGIAQRITINAAVDPTQGGETWRLRDGINAAAQGPVGEASLLQAVGDALTTPRTTADGTFAGDANTASALLSNLTSITAAKQIGTDQQLSFANARVTELTELQLADGVDTDAELQRLIQVEQAYAANARMIQVLDELMDVLNRL
ncbi:MAG: flagellar hook-associated protein FlgK [Pseudomonadota bacterium]